MKSYGGLWDRITDLEELYLAYRRARRCKRKSPVMVAFTYDLESQLVRLQRELRNEGYRPSGYRGFMIFDPKPRKVYAAAFRDRVVHHSLCAAIEPIFDRTMIYDSYACRKGKGTHAALARLDHFWRSSESLGPAYILRLDVSKYFFSIDHGVLGDLICCRLREKPVRDLVWTILGSLSTGDKPGVGIPIGNLTSQLFANVYLDQLDHFAKETLHIRHYIRYMDDIAIFANDKAALRSWLAEIEGFVGERLHLTLNPKRTRLHPAREGVPWLGFRVLAPGRRRLSRRMVVRAARRLRELAALYRAGMMGLDDVTGRLMSWIAHASYGDTWQLRASLFRELSWRPEWIS